MKLLTVTLSILTGLPLTFLSTPASAGRLAGNAAHVLTYGHTRRVDLLDFWEAVETHGFTLTEYGAQDADHIVRTVIERVRPRLPLLAEQLSDEYAFFNANNAPVSGRLPELPHFARRLPDDATPVTSAQQRDPLFPGEKLYTYSSELRERMTEHTHAGQIIHEILYRIGIDGGLDNPVGIRYLVGLLFSEQGVTEKDVSWISGMVNSRLDVFQVEGQWVPLFVDAFVPCQPTPGRTESCDKNLPNEAVKSYDDQGRLLTVLYGKSRKIPLASTGPGAPQITIETEGLRVARRVDSTFIKFAGRVTVTPSDHPAKVVQFNGYYDLINHRFCGKTSPAAPPYCGPAAEIVAGNRGHIEHASK